MTKVSDLKVGEGATLIKGFQYVKLISYMGMNKYLVSGKDGDKLVEGDQQVLRTFQYSKK